MGIYNEVIGASWIALVGIWLALSIAGVRGGGARYSPGRRLLRLALVVVVVGLGIRYGDRVSVPSFESWPSSVAAAGAVLCVLGLAFATWARFALGRNWGVPMALHDNPELVTSGPYAYVRHPIYTGLLGMWIGTSLVFPLAAGAAAFFIGYCIFSARREERDMARRFPDAYPAYKTRSKMLVPFLL